MMPVGCMRRGCRGWRRLTVKGSPHRWSGSLNRVMDPPVGFGFQRGGLPAAWHEREAVGGSLASFRAPGAVPAMVGRRHPHRLGSGRGGIHPREWRWRGGKTAVAEVGRLGALLVYVHRGATNRSARKLEPTNGAGLHRLPKIPL